MTGPAKRKGDAAERALVKHLNAHGFPLARRGRAGGEADLGDVFGIVDHGGDAWTVQVADRKWRSHSEIEAKAAEALVQAERAGTPLWCLVTKRPRASDVGDWFVWVPTWALLPHGQPDLACITVRTWLGLMAGGWR